MQTARSLGAPWVLRDQFPRVVRESLHQLRSGALVVAVDAAPERRRVAGFRQVDDERAFRDQQIPAPWVPETSGNFRAVVLPRQRAVHQDVRSIRRFGKALRDKSGADDVAQLLHEQTVVEFRARRADRRVVYGERFERGEIGPRIEVHAVIVGEDPHRTEQHHKRQRGDAPSHATHLVFLTGYCERSFSASSGSAATNADAFFSSRWKTPRQIRTSGWPCSMSSTRVASVNSGRKIASEPPPPRGPGPSGASRPPKTCPQSTVDTVNSTTRSAGSAVSFRSLAASDARTLSPSLVSNTEELISGRLLVTCPSRIVNVLNDANFTPESKITL